MSRRTGALGEAVARQYLEQQGMQVLAMNYHSRMGEIDIIALDGQCLVFAEVKQRAGDAYGSPAEFVDFRKQKRIIATALQYLQETEQTDHEVRFDVIEILKGEIRHIPAAFDATEE